MVPLHGALEAVLFAAGSEGLTTAEVAQLLDIPTSEAERLCVELQTSYASRQGGLALVQHGGAWQLVTRPEYAVYLQRMARQPLSAHLSQAALEVLAIVAYRQPISRAEIEYIRGVQSDRALQSLVQRQLVSEVGRQDAPGRPILYGTTGQFLQAFGLRSLADLPPLPAAPELPEPAPLFKYPTTTLPASD
ncbi:MAG: SMC-Scp complex subunit ScpB [Alicyclobacillus sp.]|nr:SMC-Scp complex subunit ScpB [Alicyclobacillus sp.]